jgi:hypothetical protein
MMVRMVIGRTLEPDLSALVFTVTGENCGSQHFNE